MDMKNVLLKVVSIIIVLQGFMQGIGLFIVVANYKSLSNENMILYGAGLLLSAVYIIMALRGGFLGIRSKEKVTEKKETIVKSGEVMLLANVIIVGLNAIGAAFHVNQLISVVIPIAFLGIALWQD